MMEYFIGKYDRFCLYFNMQVKTGIGQDKVRLQSSYFSAPQYFSLPVKTKTVTNLNNFQRPEALSLSNNLEAGQKKHTSFCIY